MLLRLSHTPALRDQADNRDRDGPHYRRISRIPCANQFVATQTK
ncbi:MAG: hypothetical protein NVS2B7_38600 [Herpetosiphon sp.]